MYMKRGVLKKLITETKKEFGLESIDISEETICTRGKQGQTGIIKSPGHSSPLEEIENVFVEFLVQMSLYRCSLSVKEGLALINSLIEGTKYEQAMHDFQERFCGKTMKEETEKGKVGRKYWKSFVR